MSDSYDWTPDLWEGEEVLWQGRPSQSIYVFSLNDLPLGLFIVGAFFWAIDDKSASAVPLPETLNVFLVLFSVFMACVLIWNRLFVDRSRRAQKVYALTNKRAVIADTGRRQVDRFLHLSGDTRIFKGGLSYRYIVFAKTRRLRWYLRQFLSQGICFDGPPDLLKSHSNDSLYFLAVTDRDSLMATIASTFRSTP